MRGHDTGGEAAPSLTTSGALLEALTELAAHRVALVTPYTVSVTQSLEEYLAEAGVHVTGRAFDGPDQAHLEGSVP